MALESEPLVGIPRIEASALEGETVLLPELRGVILLSDESQKNTIQLEAGAIANLGKFPVLNTPDVYYIINSFIGSPVSRESLDRLKYAIKIHLKQLGRPFSVVYLPEQDITDGYVQIVVVESRTTGDIEVEGARYFSEKLYLNAISYETGYPIVQRKLNEDVDWINRNPFRAATIAAAPGEKPGTTKLVLKTNTIP